MVPSGSQIAVPEHLTSLCPGPYNIYLISILNRVDFISKQDIYIIIYIDIYIVDISYLISKRYNKDN